MSEGLILTFVPSAITPSVVRVPTIELNPSLTKKLYVIGVAAAGFALAPKIARSATDVETINLFDMMNPF
jgi:hypothetical protein